MQRSDREHKPLSLEDPAVFRRIDRIVLALVHATEWRDDFRQEALIHFCHEVSEHPGRGLRWYLRSCYLFLRNLLRLGRSIDSLKHYAAHCRSDAYQPSDEENPVSELAAATDVRQEVFLRDTVSELFRLLRPKDQQILLLLSEGNSLPDVAVILHLSNRTTTRARLRIAAAATKIGCVHTGNKA